MAGRRGELLALAVIDLDDFKLVNDRGGHAAGDRLLVELAGVWTALAAAGGPAGPVRRRRVRPDARRGGGGACRAPSSHASRGAHPASWTAGAVLCTDVESLDEAIDRADARLYVAKAPRRKAADRDPQAVTAP